MRFIHRRRQTAFTLAQLLVVLAIIGLLIAILLPTLANVRTAAMKAACANNLRQIGHGLVLYDQDYRRLPGGESHKDVTAGPSFREALIDLYAFRPETFICSVLEQTPSSYELNQHFEGRPLSEGRAAFILASETSVAAACTRCHGGSVAGAGAHRPRSNFLFFDGHVEYLEAETASRAGAVNWGPAP